MMNRVLYILKKSCVVILMCTMIMGCKSDESIPERDLVNIFHDAFIANAYLVKKGVIPNDSMIIYEPILAKYGYTVNEFRNTLRTISERKSARISDLLAKASDRLEKEAAVARKRISILDTIDNTAKRTFKRTIYQDSLIHVKRLQDSSKLRISIKDIIPGDYVVTFNYFIDTLDKNRNSRVELYLLKNDSIQLKRHTQILTRYKDGKFSRTFNVDTTMSEMYINIFYRTNNEEAKQLDVKITDLKVVRTLPLATSVDSLYIQNFKLELFNLNYVNMMVKDTLPPKPMPEITIDTLRGNIINWLEYNPTWRVDDEA